MPDNIIFGSNYNGYRVYDQRKSAQGLHEPSLERLYGHLTFAVENMKKPRAVHIVIDRPKDFRVSQVIERAMEYECLAVQGMSSVPAFQYLYTKEIRPRGKVEHLHLVLIVDGADYNVFNGVREYLRKYSQSLKTRKVSICRRDDRYRPTRVDQETGLITFLGSAYFHDLIHEFEDALYRLSYVCKVATKKGKFQVYGSRLSKTDRFPTESNEPSENCQQVGVDVSNAPEDTDITFQQARVSCEFSDTVESALLSKPLTTNSSNWSRLAI